MDTKDLQRYKSKAKQSFKTKMNIFLFDLVLQMKECFNVGDFDKFQITNWHVEIYSACYWQNEEFVIKDAESKPTYISNGTYKSQDIYNAIIEIEKKELAIIQECEKLYIDSFESVFPKNEFEKLIEDKEDTCCHYCGISKDKIEQLADKKQLFKKTLRGWNFEIDRKNSNLEYKPENCVICCYWCNNAKTDEFTEEEFLLIAREGIAKVWERRING